MVAVRTRFAPAPTGFLHLGGARTALFAWAFARHHRGTFILRVEDTDVARSTPAAVQAIFDAMAWLGLDADEGPYFQTKRMDRYRAVLDDMLARGLAYRDYMTAAELDALREQQMARGEKPRYDGRWRPGNAKNMTLPAGVSPVIRFRNPDSGTVAWDDGVKGRVEFANAELDDLVLARADGTPTYNFCVVVDDSDMEITHVIRGDDHVNNTPRQINIFRALGRTPPHYAHVPTVLGEDGAKLSKRHGATGVMEYEAAGFLPEAMVNFLARIGWAHGDDEIFSRAQLVEWFSLEGISPAPSRFNADKLAWVNQEHMKRMTASDLGLRLAPFLARAGLDPANGPDAGEVAALLRDRSPTLVQMADQAAYFYATPHVDAAKFAEQVTPPVRDALLDLHAGLATLEWSREALASAMKTAAARHGLKPPQVMMSMRLVVCGTTTTPAIDAVLHLLGREIVRARMGLTLAPHILRRIYGMERVADLVYSVDPGAHDGAYFQGFVRDIEALPDKLDVWRKRESEFSQLDEAAWQNLKGRAVPRGRTRDERRAWQGFIACLNEARGYIYLKSLGCNDIQFVPESTTPAPDLVGSLHGQKVYCEVKTLQISDTEIDRREANDVGSTRPRLAPPFLNKVASTLERAKSQIGGLGQSKGVILMVVNFDDWIGDYKNDYYLQIDEFLGETCNTPYELVFLDEGWPKEATVSMRNARLLSHRSMLSEAN